MSELKHTVFMRGLKPLIKTYLEPEFQNYKLGETKWLFQVCFDRDKRIHYEVSRPYAKRGRMLEIGLHCESRTKILNEALLIGFQQHLFEIRATLETDVYAEMWDRGWTKIYEAYPLDVLTPQDQDFVAKRLALWIETLQPIYNYLRKEII